ncbi:MAG: type II pantothenate kinase [Eubacteriales bacterium]|nr:type II pantothenate kinase [Eubacteriales bacterium]
MKVVIGIDVGGSTTKIVGFDITGEKRRLIKPLFVQATDPITSIYGAFGKFMSENDLKLSDVEKVLTTGVGSSYITKPIYALPHGEVSEFESIGRGGLYLSGLDEAIVVSMGTGTAIVHAKKGDKSRYLGGTGVGGGTLTGLAKGMLGLDNVDHIFELAQGGDISKVDLQIRDITHGGDSSLPNDMTAANFGKLSDMASKNDIALGLVNMVFETIGMMSIFAARSCSVKNIVLTGNLSVSEAARLEFSRLSDMFGVNFIIPENSQFATVIGTALA